MKSLVEMTTGQKQQIIIPKCEKINAVKLSKLIGLLN
jgi:hypothetical protein